MPSAISRRKLIRKLKALGYTGPFSGSKHQFMKKGQHKIRIPNPHGNQEISKDLVKEILKQAGISDEEWDNS
ncbi:YcfA family protein [Microcystis aeruginosa PCC 9432]|jgi:predicted RNA binding protein YcfA (HicA-like mRNA interferase family)|uniref:YcfA family protein n=2 Tax=Microcystis aeruginosa TaxID=1126 RepID=A0A822L8C5_MICAE|nr:type II toxin-antitoxin system HicA family toxin [Microcystis aeruginosa]REJ60648.1 MAG: type II toxin-antitoxin system HicA family toxin [Microcystis aeruginosa DA14]TRT97140.1 MAG: type II toxin-antitoxin system HicA family toxin [Microcystis aeruginosa Ma_OC_LR_19540900_S633]TYT71585.1 type II toxin-antitoxin system HicA family toxin [Microcystis aeruginosa KLA2]CCH92778.1 YcfA family protein [Microcystis aeruginosa PCC 9432]CCI06291.1 YcfA family protein [Microcystis aeruginosa PCC 7941